MKNKYLTVVATLCIVGGLAFSSCNKKENNQEPAPVDNPGTVSLLANAQTGQAFTGTVNDFTLASNGSTVVLLAAQNANGKIYAVDLKDNNASQAAANAISTPVAGFVTALAARMGVNVNAVSIVNMEVNPISKAIYVLVRNATNNTNSIYKITNGGNTIEPLDVSNVSYSAITYTTTGKLVNDMTWGDNTLYFSFSNATTLAGEVASISAPFTHNATGVSRTTTVYKSNWGGNYFTDAPLESMAYGVVNGEKRLMGVTVCAPGYSFKASEISNGTSLLQVKEYFNLNTGIALKVFCVTKNNTTYLCEVHENGRIVRVGQKYLDESLTANGNMRWILTYQNGNAVPAAGLTEEDVKILAPAGTYRMAAKYSDTKLVVVGANGQLSVLDI